MASPQMCVRKSASFRSKLHIKSSFLLLLVVVCLFNEASCLLSVRSAVPQRRQNTLANLRGGASNNDENALKMGLDKVLSKIPQPYKTAAVFASGIIVGAALYPPLSSNLQVYDTAADIPAKMFKTKKTSIKGVVASVTDGDTFRIRHKTLISSGKYEGKLSENTVVIRIAAVDTPETAKFGKEGQPLGEEAKQWVKDQILDKDVSVQLLSRDQYQRVVGMVSYGTWPFKKNLSKELLKEGLAVVYRQGGAEYGGELDQFEKLEQAAKDKKIGVWSGNYESPAEFKARQKATAAASN